MSKELLRGSLLMREAGSRAGVVVAVRRFLLLVVWVLLGTGTAIQSQGVLPWSLSTSQWPLKSEVSCRHKEGEKTPSRGAANPSRILCTRLRGGNPYDGVVGWSPSDSDNNNNNKQNTRKKVAGHQFSGLFMKDAGSDIPLGIQTLLHRDENYQGFAGNRGKGNNSEPHEFEEKEDTSVWTHDVAIINQTRVTGWAPCNVVKENNAVSTLDIMAEGGFLAKNISARFVRRRGEQMNGGKSKHGKALEIEQALLDAEWKAQFDNMENFDPFDYQVARDATSEKRKRERKKKRYSFRSVELEFRPEPVGIKVSKNIVVGVKRNSQASHYKIKPGWQLRYISEHRVPAQTEKVERVLDAAISTGVNFTIQFERKTLPETMRELHDSSEDFNDEQRARETRLHGLMEAWNAELTAGIERWHEEILVEEEEGMSGDEEDHDNDNDDKGKSYRRDFLSSTRLFSSASSPYLARSKKERQLQLGQSVRFAQRFSEAGVSDIEAGDVGIVDEIEPSRKGVWLDIPGHSELRLIRDLSILEAMDIHDAPRGYNMEVMVVRNGRHVGWKPCSIKKVQPNAASFDVVSIDGEEYNDVPPLYIRKMVLEVSPPDVFDCEVVVTRRGKSIGWATCRVDTARDDGRYDVTTLQDKAKILRVPHSNIRKLSQRGRKTRRNVAPPEQRVAITKAVRAAIEKYSPKSPMFKKLFQCSIYADVQPTRMDALGAISGQLEAMLMPFDPVNKFSEKRVRVPLANAFNLTEQKLEAFLKVARRSFRGHQQQKISLKGTNLWFTHDNKAFAGIRVSDQAMPSIRKLQGTAASILDKFDLQPQPGRLDHVPLIAMKDSTLVATGFKQGPLSSIPGINKALFESNIEAKLSSVVVAVGNKKYLLKLRGTS
mmetsp:Transcript_28325/g.48076  ORF Transcript_28325/g.48076 Transcript_28325/m.48076 type:complete len:886 (+) Transcript_28325:622-3279(+)